MKWEKKRNVVKNLGKIRTDTVYTSCMCLTSVQELHLNRTFEGSLKQILTNIKL